MHIGLLCPDMTGHLNPMLTLGQVLVRRHHRVSLIGMSESRIKATANGLGFIEIGAREHARGLLNRARQRLGQLRGWAALRYTGQMLRAGTAIVLRDAPAAARAAGVEGMIIDQISPGSTVAELLDVPFAVVCNALALHQEPAVPPPVTTWTLRTDWIGRLRNRLGNRLLAAAARPIRQEVNAMRQRHGRLPYCWEEIFTHGLVQVAQQPAFFDFPRQQLPAHFHYTGPWHHTNRDADIAFPWDRLDGRPVVYASLGTLQNRLQPLFAAIAAACRGLPVQLVISLGRPDADVAMRLPLPHGAIVVSYAPQLPLLDKAALVMTHAGLNTVLETLARGKPMVAIPLANDQPGVARRAAWLGAAEIVGPKQANGRNLRTAIRALLENPTYFEAARRCREQLRCSPGVDEAAALIDRALVGGSRIERY